MRETTAQRELRRAVARVEFNEFAENYFRELHEFFITCQFNGFLPWAFARMLTAFRLYWRLR